MNAKRYFPAIVAAFILLVSMYVALTLYSTNRNYNTTHSFWYTDKLPDNYIGRNIYGGFPMPCYHNPFTFANSGYFGVIMYVPNKTTWNEVIEKKSLRISLDMARKEHYHGYKSHGIYIDDRFLQKLDIQFVLVTFLFYDEIDGSDFKKCRLQHGYFVRADRLFDLNVSIDALANEAFRVENIHTPIVNTESSVDQENEYIFTGLDLYLEYLDKIAQ